MWNRSRFLLFVISLALLSSCSEVGKRDLNNQTGSAEQNTSRGVLYNPSELALSMREMYDNLQASGRLLRQKKEVGDSLFQDFSHILTDKPTKPADIGPKFQAFAAGWLEHYSEFRTSRDLEHYNAVMNACVTCHQQFCPGPISKIEKLKLFP